MTLMSPTPLSQISIGFMDNRQPLKYQIYVTPYEKIDRLFVDMDVEYIKNSSSSFKNEYRIGSFKCHDGPTFNNQVQYITLNNHEHKIMQVRITFLEPSTYNNAFTQIGIKSIALHKYKPKLIIPQKIVINNTLSKNLLLSRNTPGPKANERNLQEEVNDYYQLSRRKNLTVNRKGITRMLLGNTQDYSTASFSSLNTSMIDDYKDSAVSLIYDQSKESFFEDTSSLERTSDLNKKHIDLINWQDTLRVYLQEAVKNQNFEQAQKIQREIRMTRFQLLQLKPILQDMKERQDQEKFMNQTKEFERTQGYKQRVLSIQSEFQSVKSLIEKISPSKFEEKEETQLRTISLPQIHITESTIDTQTQEVFKQPEQKELNEKYRRYKNIIPYKLLINLQEHSSIQTILQTIKDIQPYLEQNIVKNTNLTLELTTLLLKDYESPILMNQIISLVKSVVLEFFKEAALIPKKNQQKILLIQLLEQLIIQLIIKQSQFQSNLVIQEIMLSFFKFPLYSQVLTNTLANSAIYQKSLLSSHKIMITRLRLLHFALQQLKLNGQLISYISFQNDKNLYLINGYVFQCLEHKSKEVRAEALKTLKFIYESLEKQKMQPWVQKMRRDPVIVNEVLKNSL